VVCLGHVTSCCFGSVFKGSCNKLLSQRCCGMFGSCDKQLFQWRCCGHVRSCCFSGVFAPIYCSRSVVAVCLGRAISCCLTGVLWGVWVMWPAVVSEALLWGVWVMGLPEQQVVAQGEPRGEWHILGIKGHD